MKRYWKLVPLFLIVFGCAANRSNATNSNLAFNLTDDSEVEEIYIKRCGGCHGTDGEPRNDSTPDFTDPKFHASRTDKQLIESVTEGKDGGMPGYGSILEKEQIEQLVAHIRKLNKKPKK